MTEDAIAFSAHDHAGCVAGTVRHVELVCAERRLRLTALRRRVLELLLEEHRAMGAYDVLARLSAEGVGAHPPAAYRALDFLVEHGFVHRIERMNAFVACAHPATAHRPAFLICRDCRAVAETKMASEDRALGEEARRIGFAVQRVVVEAEGLCPACRDTGR